MISYILNKESPKSAYKSAIMSIDGKKSSKSIFKDLRQE